MSSLMRRTSPRIAALCSRVSPRSFRLFTLSLVLDAEFGVPFWPRLDCDWCFGVVSVRREMDTHQHMNLPLTQFVEFAVTVSFTWPTMFMRISGALVASRGQYFSKNRHSRGWTYFTWAHFITFTRLNPSLNHICIIEFAQLLSQMIFETHSLNLSKPSGMQQRN